MFERTGPETRNEICIGIEDGRVGRSQSTGSRNLALSFIQERCVGSVHAGNPAPARSPLRKENRAGVRSAGYVVSGPVGGVRIAHPRTNLQLITEFVIDEQRAGSLVGVVVVAGLTREFANRNTLP